MVGSGGGFADEGFQLGERHLDGVQVGRIGRQEDEVVALCAQKFDGARGFVGGEVVGNDDLAGPEGRGQIVLDVGFETVAVHRAIEHPGRHDAVATKACNEGLSMPVAEGGMVDQALADRGPARGLHEVGLEARLVNENQPFQHVGKLWLACLNPDPLSLSHVGAQLFAGEQCFFYG